MKEKVLEQIKNSKDDMLNVLEKMVNIDSGADSLEGINEIAHIIGDFLVPLGFTVEYLETPGAPTHILAKRPRAGKKKVMLMGHMDTVFFKGTAAARPFKVEDGKAYGPGVMDMKAGIAMTLYIVKALVDNEYNDVDLTIFFCGDEEVSHPKTNAVEIFKSEAQGKAAVFNMEPGRPDGSFIIGRKGSLRPNIKVKGIPVHAGNEPENGASAILELARKTIDFQELTDFEVGTTYNVGVVSGGTVANIVAEDAEAKLDIRFKTIEEAEKAIKDVEKIAGKSYDARTSTTIERNFIEFMPFETTDAVMKLYQHMGKQAEKLGLAVPKGDYAGGCSDAAWTAMVGAPTLCAVGPQAVGAHTNNEYLYVDSIIERSLMVALAIMNIYEI